MRNGRRPCRGHRRDHRGLLLRGRPFGRIPLRRVIFLRKRFLGIFHSIHGMIIPGRKRKFSVRLTPVTNDNGGFHAEDCDSLLDVWISIGLGSTGFVGRPCFFPQRPLHFRSDDQFDERLLDGNDGCQRELFVFNHGGSPQPNFLPLFIQPSQKRNRAVLARANNPGSGGTFYLGREKRGVAFTRRSWGRNSHASFAAADPWYSFHASECGWQLLHGKAASR